MKCPVKRASQKQNPTTFLARRRRPTKMFPRRAVCPRFHHDQQTLPMQNRAMREYAARRGWAIALQVEEVGSGAAQREDA